MDYSKYIEIGFKRTDMNDNVEFNQTGYHGFCLSKKINKKLSISVCAGELDKPNLYIKKLYSDRCHIIPITPECVIDLVVNENNNN